jgi:ribosome-associated protein
MTTQGVLILEAKQFRTQEQNREEALRRLVELVRKAAVKPRTRRRTKPTAASREVRLTSKKRRGELKRLRRGNRFD